MKKLLSTLVTTLVLVSCQPAMADTYTIKSPVPACRDVSMLNLFEIYSGKGLTMKMVNMIDLGVCKGFKDGDRVETVGELPENGMDMVEVISEDGQVWITRKGYFNVEVVE